jgi:oligopeptide transport system substrate-binding protein
MKNRILALLLALAMVASFAACGSTSQTTADTTTDATDTTAADTAAAADSSDDTASADAAASTVSGDYGLTNTNVGKGMYTGTAEAGAITVECSTMDRMNPLLQTYNTEFSLNRHVWDCLVKLDDTNAITPAAATSWESSEDGMTWTFHLREGAKWVDCDGNEVANVTANDFVFAWSQLLNPEVAAEYANFAMIFKNATAYYNYLSGESDEEVTLDQVGFKAVDDYTLEIELENNLPYLLQYLKFEVMAPIYQPFYEEVGADKYGTSPDTLLYNGPFRMTEWVTESSITTVKNESWWDAANVELEKIYWVKYTDTNTKYNAFVSNEIDIIDITGDQRSMFEAEGFDVSSYSGGYSFFYWVNTTGEYLSNVNLRKAISAALDRTQIINTVYKNDNQVPTALTYGISGVNTETFAEVVVAANGGNGLYEATADETLAKEYLDKAIEELGVSSAEDITIDLLTSEGTQGELQSQVVQEQLRKVLGINVTVTIKTLAETRELRNSLSFDMFMGGWGPDYNDPMTFIDLFESTNGNNHTGYADDDYDALVASARAETDLEAREQIFVEAEFKLAEDLPIIPVYMRCEDFVASEKLASGYVRKSFQGYNLIYTKLAG